MLHHLMPGSLPACLPAPMLGWEACLHQPGSQPACLPAQTLRWEACPYPLTADVAAVRSLLPLYENVQREAPGMVPAQRSCWAGVHGRWLAPDIPLLLLP
jgi:hypothetical protein